MRWHILKRQKWLASSFLTSGSNWMSKGSCSNLHLSRNFLQTLLQHPQNLVFVSFIVIFRTFFPKHQDAKRPFGSTSWWFYPPRAEPTTWTIGGTSIWPFLHQPLWASCSLSAAILFGWDQWGWWLILWMVSNDRFRSKLRWWLF